MLWTIFVILLVLWLLGFTLHIALPDSHSAGHRSDRPGHQPGLRTPQRFMK